MFPAPPNFHYVVVLVDEQRGDVRLPVTLRVVFERDEQCFAEYTANISRTGLFLHSRRPFPVGTELDLVVYWSDEKEAPLLRAVVRWLQPKGDGVPGGMGVQFMWDNEEQRTHFDDMVRKLTCTMDIA